MIKDAVGQIKELKNISKKTINIPLTYLLFMGTCFLVWKPEYVLWIDILSWMPGNIKNIILGVTGLVYANIIIILLCLLITIGILLLISEKTPVFYKFLPEDVEYTDNTTVMWNQYSAIKKLFSIIIHLCTNFFIYYFTLNIIFNEHNYSQNFFLGEATVMNNDLITSGYLTEGTLVVMNGLFWLNTIILVYYICRALFEIRIPTNEVYLKNEDLAGYIKINSFKEKNSLEELFEISILKTKYRKKTEFLLVSVQLTRREFKYDEYSEESRGVLDDVPQANLIHDILDRTDNLSDIIYHFDVLKENASNIKN